jgi:inorganic phosphate transporter, PiT family
MLTLVIITICIAFLYDFLNGMNDAGNSIATIVATNVLPPKIAVLWAAFFNFLAFLVLGTHVAATIGKGIIVPDVVKDDPLFILSALLGAGIWVLICASRGMPNSVSHALVGGLIGPALIKGGASAIFFSGIFKIIIFIILAPVFGFIIGYLFMALTLLLVRKKTPAKVDRWFRVLQLASSAAFSLGHGGNDAQKTMGIVLLLLISTGYLPANADIPIWVVLIAYSCIALGTLTGAWKVIKTLGMGLTHLRPIGGFCAETAGALTLFGVTLAGIPVSTTHTITGAIMGVGITKSASSVKWKIAKNIVVAWILTIPATMVMSAIVYTIIHLFV